MRFSSRAENADKAASKCVTSVGLFLFWFIGCFWHHFPNEWMCVCLPDIEQLGKHGRSLCSLHPHVLLMGSSSHKANSHSGFGLESNNERGTEQELWPCVMLEHASAYGGEQQFLKTQSKHSWSAWPGETFLQPSATPQLVCILASHALCAGGCKHIQIEPSPASGVCGALGADRVLVPVVVLWCSLAMQSLR